MKRYKMKHTAGVILIILMCIVPMEGTAWGETGEQESLHITRALEGEELADLEAPPQIYLAQDGREYELSRWEIKEIPGRKVSGRRKQQVVYDGVEGAEQLPEAITVTEEMTGVPAEGKLTARSTKILKEEWQEGFTAPVIFHSYGADEYEAGDLVIPAGDALSYTEELEGALLSLMGLSREEYRIHTIEWEGEPYMDESGQLCRRALAAGQKLIRDIEITYEGEISWMEPVSYQQDMVYQSAVEDPVTVGREGRDPVPQTRPIPVPEPEPERSPLWYWVRSGFVITVAAGLLGILVGAVLLLVIWNRRRRETDPSGHLPQIKG